MASPGPDRRTRRVDEHAVERAGFARRVTPVPDLGGDVAKLAAPQPDGRFVPTLFVVEGGDHGPFVIHQRSQVKRVLAQAAVNVPPALTRVRIANLTENL